MCGDKLYDGFFELLDAGAYVRLFGVCWVFESVQTGVLGRRSGANIALNRALCGLQVGGGGRECFEAQRTCQAVVEF